MTFKIIEWSSFDDIWGETERLKEEYGAKDYYDGVSVILLLDKEIDELQMPEECLVRHGFIRRGDYYLFCGRCSEFNACPNAVLDDGEAAY